MLNEFGSYADAIDNTKNDLSRKSAVASSSDRNNCCAVAGGSPSVSNVSDAAPRPVPSAAGWNCNPYLGNFYNYYGNNGYDIPVAAATAVPSDVHQYDNQKCAAGVNQFTRNYTQHTIQSASVLQCCDPRCQLISDHAKYPFNNNLANKYNGQRVVGKGTSRKACYGLETPSKGELNGHVTHVAPFSYGGAPSQHDLNKYNGQQQPQQPQQQQQHQQQQHYGALYQTPMKASKQVLLPSEASSFGDYYTDIGKPAYWSKPNVWNRGMSASHYGPAEMQKMATAASMYEQNSATANQRGILFNRLLERRNRAMYDMSYMPNYHYGRPPPPPPPLPPSSKNAAAYCQSYQVERDVYSDCGNTRVPLQNDSYQTLPMYNVHCVEPPSGTPRDAKDTSKQDTQSNTKSRVRDVREFLSTWDDVEEDKAPESETPVIVLDCSSLEGDALAKVKEKLGDTVTNLSNPIENDFNSHPGSTTVLKVVDDHNNVSPHTSVIQESVTDSTTLVSKKDKCDKPSHHIDSSHTPDNYNATTWYGQQQQQQHQQQQHHTKKKDDLSYDLVEMTERLVNTVDKLFGDEKSDPKNTFYETRREPEVVKDDQWNINLNYKRNKIDKITPPSTVPDHRYRPIPKEDFAPVYKASALLPDYAKEPEKNVSCSFNLQKSNNDLKFSVNYSKQTECYSSGVQDYSVKYKNYEAAKIRPPRVEEYSYKNYYNSYYFNNPSCEYMQMENVKECTYDVENIDNHNASDITLVKADLEKSLKEITHQFSYQKKPESTDKQLPPKTHQSHDTVPNDTDGIEKSSSENPVLPTSVIQKTGTTCSVGKVLDEREDSFNDNSMLSMPSLSPPPSCPPASQTKPNVGLTLNDVYDDEVIFDTLNAGKPDTEDEPQLNFTNVFKKMDTESQRDSVVYPLNLALTKETTKEAQPSVLKFTSTATENDNECDTVFKADDGYYSLETHSEKDAGANDLDEAKKTLPADVQQPVYKTCIVSRELYEHSDDTISRVPPSHAGDGLPILEVSNLAEPQSQSFTPVLNLAKENANVPITDGSTSQPISDTESLGKPDDVFGKLHNSSTDDEKLLKSSKFKKYKKLKKLKSQQAEESATSDSVIKENGNVTHYKHIFPNIQACSEDSFVTNHLPDFPPKCQINGHAGENAPSLAPASLPILVSEDTDNLDNNYNIKKRKFTSSVKDANLPVKKRKQVGIEANTAAEESAVVQTANATTIEPRQLEDQGDAAIQKYSLNGKYQVDSVDHKITAHRSPPSSLCSANSSHQEDEEDGGKRGKKKHKKDRNKLKVKCRKQKKNDKNYVSQSREFSDSNSADDDTKSPDRTMSNDEPTDPYKSPSSGSEVVKQNGENYVAPVHAIYQNDDHHSNRGADDRSDDVREPVENGVVDIDSCNDHVIATEDNKITLDVAEQHSAVDVNDKSAPEERDNERLGDADNWTGEKHTLSDTENYSSPSCKKFKPCVTSNDETRGLNSPTDPVDPVDRDNIKENSVISLSKPKELEEELVDHQPENIEDSPKGRDSGFNEPDTQMNEEPNSPLPDCFSPQFAIFKNKLSPLKDSPPHETASSIIKQIDHTEPPVTSCVVSVDSPLSPKQISDLKVTKLPIIDTELDNRVDQSPGLASVDNKDHFISHIPETIESKCSEPCSSISVEIGEQLKPGGLEQSAGEERLMEPFDKIEVNSLKALKNEALPSPVEPPLNLSWSKEPSPIRCDKEDTDEWAKIPEKSIWSHENSPLTSISDDTHQDDLIWSPAPLNDLTVTEEKPPMGWLRESSSFRFDENIDHEEAIADIPEAEKSIWSNHSLQTGSDDEDVDTTAPRSPVHFIDFDHETIVSSSMNEYPMSPWSRRHSRSRSDSDSVSEPESPKRSVSSDPSSDSDDSDSSSASSSRASKSSSSKSTCSKHRSAESDDDEMPMKSDSSCESSDDEQVEPKAPESSSESGDESVHCDKIDYLFNIPSVAPTPQCDLNKEDGLDEPADVEKDIRSKAPSPNFDLHEEPFASDLKLIKAPSPFCILNDNIADAVVNRVELLSEPDKNERSSKSLQYFSDESSISSVAPSPNCDIIDGVLLDDTDTGKSDDFGFDKALVPYSPEPVVCQIAYEEVPTLRTLAAKTLAEMSFNSVPAFNRLEVWVTPERTEIIIHSEETDPNQTDLVIANDNHVMITDAYEDDDVNIAPNFDKLKEISFDYAMGLESTTEHLDKSEDDLQCQCLIISSEESIICLRCSLNSSVIVNRDLNDIENHYQDEPEYVISQDNEMPAITDHPWNSPNESNCIEDSFIDHKLTLTPDRDEQIVQIEPIPQSQITVDEDKQADDEVQTITGSQPRIARPHISDDIQIKVELPWHKIFNLGTIGRENQNTLELGPAQIEVRLSPDDATLWKLVNAKQERVSPVVKVKRLILQRACGSPAADKDSPVEPNSSLNQESATDLQTPAVSESSKKFFSRLPKMVIKKTSCKEYKSFLQMNAMQPVVKLYKNKSLDELARKMSQQNNFSVNLKQLEIKSNTESVSSEITPDPVERSLIQQFSECKMKGVKDESKSMKSQVAEKEDTNSSTDLVTVLDTTPPRDAATKPERHHCLLCHRSFTCEQAYQVHVKGRFHRHLELTQRKTIHAMYRHFTGHICPRLRPLSVKERKKMKWKPRSANVDHFYYQKTPLQIALHKSIHENEQQNVVDEECS